MVTAGIAAFGRGPHSAGRRPSVVAGHSLGEYAALVAAGALTLQRLRCRWCAFAPQAMQEAVPEGQSARWRRSSASTTTAVRAACAEAAQGEVVQAVNFNAPGQVVIAGHKAAVGRAIDACKARGAKRAMPLPVSAPFHSSLMQPAAERLRGYLAQVPIAAPRIPVINNVDVASRRATRGRIKDALVRQAASPVRWVETMQAMARAGRHPRRRMRPGQGAGRACASASTPSLQGLALADRACARAGVRAVIREA